MTSPPYDVAFMTLLSWYVGKIQYDDSWSSPARQRQMQTEMVKACEAATNDKYDIVASHPHPTDGTTVHETYCFMSQLKEYCEASGKEFPRPDGPHLTAELLSFNNFNTPSGRNQVSGIQVCRLM
jgi:hypothetical protein